jgi:hypothetical protein
LIGGVLGRWPGWLPVAILAVMTMLAGIAFGDPGQPPISAYDPKR